VASAQPETLTITDGDAVTVYVYRWVPDGDPKAVVHLAHGMGEHARRYDRVAATLTAAGYVVYADDHRASGRTGVEGAGLGDLGPGGMLGALESLHHVMADVAARDPGAPMCLLGHSWGSFLAQRVAERWDGELAGLILSGSTLLAEPYIDLGDPNAHFQPAATPYDWLSRDPAEVQRYIDDPWCGLEVAFDIGELLHLATPPADTVPPALAVLVLNGSDDAVGGFNGGGAALADAYRELGLHDVTFIGYPGARHELFNESNRDQVLADLVAWLDAHAG
jgi:alpha-beta hydrolase superfamily lysophospholipase